MNDASIDLSKFRLNARGSIMFRSQAAARTQNGDLPRDGCCAVARIMPAQKDEATDFSNRR